MKKLCLAFLLIMPVFLNAQIIRSLTSTIELKMPKTTEDSMPGTRGGAVVWHPVQKKYYAAFAGNGNYPMAVFDNNGKRLSGDELTCMADLRGLWFNTKLKKICGNGYNETGWFNYTLDVKGIPIELVINSEGMNQPGKQSIGVYNPNSNMVYFLNGQNVEVYNSNAMPEEDSTIRLYPGISRKEAIVNADDASVLHEDYNNNELIYTGFPKAEFGLLNTNLKQVELYNRKTGLMTQKLKLPEDIELWTAFNFSYTNGIYWSFNQDTRIWTGYK